MKEKRYFNLEPNIFFAGLTSFLTDTSAKMVYSIMPLFLLSLGASKTTLSLIEGIAESTASLLKAVSGFWSDKAGKNKPFMIFGYGVTALVTPLYALTGTSLQVLLLRFLERIGKGVRTAPRDSLISKSINRSESGKNFGFHKAMDNSGAIIGPFFASILLLIFPLNYGYVFILASIPALMGVITIVLYIKEKEGRVNENQNGVSIKQLPRSFYYFLIVIFIFSLGNSTDALLLVKTSESGIRQSFVPFFYMLFNTVSVIFAVPAGRMSDKIGREKMIIIGFLMYALVYLLFGAYNHFGVFSVAFVLYGFYSALTDSSQKAMISDLTGSEIKGSAFGIYHAVLGITLLPASVIAGYLYDHVNASAPFYFGATMALIAAILLIVFTFLNKLKPNL